MDEVREKLGRQIVVGDATCVLACWTRARWPRCPSWSSSRSSDFCCCSPCCFCCRCFALLGEALGELATAAAACRGGRVGGEGCSFKRRRRLGDGDPNGELPVASSGGSPGPGASWSTPWAAWAVRSWQVLMLLNIS